MAKKSKPTKPKLPPITKWSKQIFLGLLITITTLFLSYLAFLGYYQGKIYPGVNIGSYKASGQTPEALYQTLSSEFNSRANNPLKFELESQSFQVNLSSSSPQLDLGSKIKEAYKLGRSQNPFQDLKDHLSLLLFGKTIDPELAYQDKTKLTSQLDKINESVKKDPQDAVLVFENSITVQESKQGMGLDIQALNSQIESYLSLKGLAPTSLTTKTTDPGFTTESAQKAKAVLESVKETPVVLSYLDQKWEINQPTLYSLLDLKTGKLLDEGRVQNYIETISIKINKPLKNPRFQVDNSGPRPKVTEFQAAQEGQKVDIEQTKYLISESLIGGTRQITLPVKITQPNLGTSDTNNLGIETLLDQGVSHFSGSIENRIYNLKLAASRINGILVAPGETFSWNQTVGDISAATGYRPAYVIKSGRTVLDDGGGVCQTSTTLFRAVLNAGLPVVSRTAHAYRVAYYEQGFPPGMDATIFHPTVDFKFKNDTRKYILLQAYSSGYTLYVDIYGTPDGRSVELTKPSINSQTPPPPELRQDDPTLPKGVVKQVDWAAWGAQVSFKRTVTKGGEKLIDETFYSNYKPWQAVYLIGTGEN